MNTTIFEQNNITKEVKKLLYTYFTEEKTNKIMYRNAYDKIINLLKFTNNNKKLLYIKKNS